MWWHSTYKELESLMLVDNAFAAIADLPKNGAAFFRISLT
jgi:hypothetical protein